MEKVGFIGLGSLGKPMAERLVSQGCDLTVHDIRKEPQEELVKMGAKGAASPRQVAETCPLIIVTVMDEADTEQVITGQDGIITGMMPGAIIAIMGTVSPAFCRSMAGEVSKQGGSLIDAPVSRGPGAPEVGTLTIMVGGNREDYERFLPVLKLLGRRFFHLGSVGSGEIAKLFNNLVLCVNILVTMEAFTLAKSAGMDIEQAREIMMVGSGYSHALELWDKLTSGGSAGIARMHKKDLALAAQLADSYGVDLPLTKYSLAIDFADKLDELLR